MRAVRIHPDMQFHPPFVGFSDPEFQRVIIRRRRFAGLSGQEIGPGLQIAFVHGIGRRPDLKDHGVEIRIFQQVEQLYGFVFLLLGGEGVF